MNIKAILLPRIGAHKSIAGSIDLAIDRGLKSGCECLQIFSRPPRRWSAGKSSLSSINIVNFVKKSKLARYYDTAIHLPYLPNIASPNDEIFEKSVGILIEEIKTAMLLQIPYVVTHLGSPKDQDIQFAVKRVADALNQAIEKISLPVKILLENSTSRRRTWGKKIEHIEAILGYIDDEKYIGMCFDTAHAYSSGYDISTRSGLNNVVDSIDQLLGKNKLVLIHINDSKGALGSGIDNHEHIGKGFIGEECFRELMQNRRFEKIPMILETPKDSEKNDFNNLELLRMFRREIEG